MRLDIINIIKEDLKLINGTGSYLTDVDERVYSIFKTLDNINDFPTICFHIEQDYREHIGGGEIIHTLRFNFRGYIKSEKSIEAAEDLGSDMEYIINTLADRHAEIESSKILSMETDEGLFSPFGIVIITAEVVYC